MPHDEQLLKDFEVAVGKFPRETAEEYFKRNTHHRYVFDFSGKHLLEGPFGSTWGARDTKIFFLSGENATNGQGEEIINLTSLFTHCYGLYYPATSIHFVALPVVAKSPVILTSEQLIAEFQLDGTEWNGPAPGPGLQARIRVLSWRLDGKPAPSVVFNWACTCEAAWLQYL